MTTSPTAGQPERATPPEQPQVTKQDSAAEHTSPAQQPVPEQKPAAQKPAAQDPVHAYRPLPPAPPGFFKTRWTGPSYAGGKAAWIGALIGGLAMAIALPLSRSGIGWLLVGLVMAGVVGHAARFGPKPDTRQERLIRAGWGVLSLSLLAVGTFISAGWLFFFCVMASLGCASLAVAGGRSVRAVTIGMVAAPVAAMRSVPWLAGGFTAWQKTRDKQARSSRIAFSVIITVVLLLVFGGLFASADVAFRSMLENVLPELSTRAVFRGLVYTLVGGLLTAGGVFVVLSPPDLTGLERPASRRIGRIELVLPLGALILLFGAFVAVQLRFLFGDREFIQSSSGLTYSEYAVQGFGQLLVVTVLVLAVIGAASRWAGKDTGVDRLLLRCLLGALVVFSMVIVASAAYRMWLYQNAYGWTRERVFFGAVELWLGGILLLVLIAGVRLRAPWFPRAVVAGFAALLLALSVSNPERFIAQQNVERFEKIDFWYLRALGPDAVPELLKLPEPYRSCALSWVDKDLKNSPDQWYSWNLSRARARQALADMTIPSAKNSCRDAQEINQHR